MHKVTSNLLSNSRKMEETEEYFFVENLMGLKFPH